LGQVAVGPNSSLTIRGRKMAMGISRTRELTRVTPICEGAGVWFKRQDDGSPGHLAQGCEKVFAAQIQVIGPRLGAATGVVDARCESAGKQRSNSNATGVIGSRVRCSANP
jgi:hypothetical protein